MFLAQIEAGDIKAPKLDIKGPEVDISGPKLNIEGKSKKSRS